MNTKPRLVEATDPDEIEAIMRDKGDLSVPFAVSPNGYPWVDVEELARWRSTRTSCAEPS